MVSSSGGTSSTTGFPGLTDPELGMVAQPPSRVATRSATDAAKPRLRIAHPPIRNIGEISSAIEKVDRLHHARRRGAGRIDVLGLEWKRRDDRGAIHRARNREPEHRARAGLRPHVEHSAVRHCVFERDREAETGAADRAHAAGVTTPESVEDARGLLLGHAEAVVAYREGDRRLVAVDGDDDRAALAVLDGVAEEVAHDAADSARVDLGVEVAARGNETQLTASLAGELVHG